MIISIRGTSGSGKSTIVRQIMARCGNQIPHYIAGRKQPIGYRMANGNRVLSILGHYESACGGCDTIHSLDQIFDLADSEAKLGYDVIFEGVMLYCEVNRTVELGKKHPMNVVALNVPIDECVYSINVRRWEKGNPEPVDPTNTQAKHERMIPAMKRIQAAGLHVEWCSRQEALAFIMAQLGVSELSTLLT